MKRIFLFVLPLMVWSSIASAKRADKADLKKTDEYVASLGHLEGYYLKHIVDTLSHSRMSNPELVARAIYAWEAMNIYYNCSGHNHPKQNNTTTSYALNERKTTHEGYALLFKEMCNMANIKCVIIPGMAKFSASNIGKLSDKWNRHTWNAIEIGGVWYPVDVTWGAGSTDKKFKFFTPGYTDAWFMVDKELFAISHFPDDKKWQMIDSPINKSTFTFAPIVGVSAIKNQVYPAEGVRGSIKGKSDTTKELVFEVGDPSLIRRVTIIYSGVRRDTVPFTIRNNMMYVDVPMHSAGKRTTNIYINDTIAYTYRSEVTQSNILAKARAAARKQQEKERKDAALAKAKEEKALLAQKEKDKKLALAEKAKAEKDREAQRLADQKEQANARKLAQAEKVKADKEKEAQKLADQKEQANARKLAQAEKAKAQQEKKLAMKEEDSEKSKASKEKKAAKKEEAESKPAEVKEKKAKKAKVKEEKTEEEEKTETKKEKRSKKNKA